MEENLRENRSEEMNNSLKYKLSAGIWILVLVCIFLPSTVSAQRVLFLNVGNSGSLDPDPTYIDNAEIKVGEVLKVDVWFDVGTTNDMNGISCYITVDNSVFELIDQNTDNPGVQPFYPSGFTVFQHELANRVEAVATNATKFVGHFNMDSGQTVNKVGRVGRFEVKAIRRASMSQITIDYDLLNHRDTRMFLTNLSSRPFDILNPLDVTVYGVNIEGIPDVLMEPGETLPNYFDLDDYIVNPPVEPENLGLTVTSSDSVLVQVNSATHEVSFTALEGFIGYRDFVFTVTDEFQQSDKDTMRVIVSYRPQIGGFLKENVLEFNEDESYSGLWLDTLATDQDNEAAFLSWCAYTLDDSIQIAVDDSVARTFTINSKPNWFGEGDVVFIVKDVYGAFDTVITHVNVLSVNDEPYYTEKLPDIHILPGEIDSSLILVNYVNDIDTPNETLNYTVTGNTNVNVRFTTNINSQAVISHKTGFLGTETVYIRVWDVDINSSSVDTILVTVGPKPPQFFAHLPDTVIFSSNVRIPSYPYVDLRDYVIDPDNDFSDLSWSYNDFQLDLGMNFSEGLASFDIPVRLHKVEDVIITATDPGGTAASDSIRVLVVQDGRPLIFDLPDEYFIPAGGSVQPFMLDTVVYDDESTNLLSWQVVGQTKILVSIDAVTHVLTLSSPDPDFLGTETVVFTATDRQGNKGTHQMVLRAVQYDIPVVLDIPDVAITKNTPKSINLNDYLIIFPDSLLNYIEWSISPQSDPRVLADLNVVSNVVEFSVIDESFKGARNFTLTATNQLNGASDSDAMQALVSFGEEPIIGHLPDIAFQSGDTVNAFNLNKYVIDPDTPDDSLEWVFDSPYFNIFADQNNLKRGAGHELVVWARRGFTGIENVAMTAVDPEGNTATDTIEVRVTSSASLDMVIIPSPVSLDYVDVVVFASDSLLGSPAITMIVNNVPEEINAVKIPTALIWKGDYVFSMGQTGEVKILTTAADNSGSVIRDSTKFTLGEVSAAQKFSYSDIVLSLEIGTGGVSAQNRVMVMPEEFRHMKRIYSEDIGYPAGLEFPLLSYYFGPYGMPDISESQLRLDLESMIPGFNDVRQYGLYYHDDDTGDIRFVSPVTVSGRPVIETDLSQLGRYFVSADIRPPEILDVESVNKETLTFNVRIMEEESGIFEAYTAVNGEIYPNYISGGEEVYSVRLDDDFTDTGDFTLDLAVADRAGNVSETIQIPFYLDDVHLPKHFVLEQNYPNPFNPTTAIRFQTPLDEYVELKIFNVNGQLVKTLLSENMEAGYHTVKWDGRNTAGLPVSAGIYIYTVRTGSFSGAKKMVLIK